MLIGNTRKKLNTLLTGYKSNLVYSKSQSKGNHVLTT